MNAVAMAATSSVGRGKYKIYPSYKASDVTWLKDVPAHWLITHLKYAAPVATTKLTNKPSDLPYIGLENIESGTGRLLPGASIEEVDGTVSIFSCGDILFGKLRPYLAKVVYATFDGVCSTEVLAFRPRKDVDGRYLFYRLLSDDFINLVNSLTYGAKMPRANPEQIGTISLALPPKIEQHAIVAFLDREMAKIDALIAKKERLIEVLEEKRTALISTSVTRGLSSNVSLNDSRVEWLGDVPSHWTVARLKQVCRESALYGANESAESYADDGVRFLRTTDIDDNGGLRTEGAVYLDRALVGEYILKNGDLLISRSGTLGRSFIYDAQRHGECAYAGYLVRFVLDRDMEPRFAFYFTKSRHFADWLSVSVIQSTIGNVNGQKYANMPLPVPPLDEQRGIVAYLNRETSRLGELIGKVREHIGALREHRTALISAAVTGKIDVREDLR